MLQLFLCALFLKLAASQDDEFVFNGFHGKNLSLDGLAEITPEGLLVLTNLTKHAKGHAFYSSPLRFKQSPVGNIISFSTSFVFAIVPEYPKMGGNGFAFTLSPSTDFSGAWPNQYLGLLNSTNNGNSLNHIFAIEFDTVINPEFKDINDNHIGMDINGLISYKSSTAGYVSNDNGRFQNLSLSSGQPIQVWIEYDGIDMQLNVTLSPFKMPKPNLPLMSSTVNLSDVISDRTYVGFSASTGNSHSNHYILGWSFKMDGMAKSLNLPSLPSVPPNPNSFKKLKAYIIWLPVALSVFVIVTLAAVVFIVIRKKKYSELLEDWELDFGPHRFSYKDLFKATKGFKDKYLLGIGGFGRVYRGVLPTSKIDVAVKRVSHESRQGVKQFTAEIVSLGKLQHRNLVKLLGYCRRKGELLLVYDFMPNGSLDKFLFDQARSTLDWNQRFRIIKGVASGLLYLHEDWEQVIIHRDVKASNVLLDSNMNGRLGDFGLARLYNHGTDPKTTHVVGTMGYLAPELTRTGKATTSTDVFAFGAFLLEVACGRRPIELTKQPDEQILLDWVFENWKKGMILETRDPRFRDEYVVEELELVLKLGLLCSHPLPMDRPSMRQVVQYLNGDIPLPGELPSLSSVSSLAFVQKEEGFGDYIMSFPSLVSSSSSKSHGYLPI